MVVNLTTGDSDDTHRHRTHGGNPGGRSLRRRVALPSSRSVDVLREDFVYAVFELAEKLVELRVIHRPTGIVHQ